MSLQMLFHFLLHLNLALSVVLDYEFKLTSPNTGNHTDDFARSIGVSDTLLVIGAPWDNHCDGSATIFDINTSSFTGNNGTKLSPRTPRGFFGSVVAANEDFVVIADATLYLSIFSAKKPYDFLVLLPVPIFDDILDVTISQDNTIIVAGLNEGRGVVYIFEQDGHLEWNRMQCIDNKFWSFIARGVSVSVSTNHMAIGVGYLAGTFFTHFFPGFKWLAYQCFELTLRTNGGGVVEPHFKYFNSTSSNAVSEFKYFKFLK